jgi:hypothetical protein
MHAHHYSSTVSKLFSFSYCSYVHKIHCTDQYRAEAEQVRDVCVDAPVARARKDPLLQSVIEPGGLFSTSGRAQHSESLDPLLKAPFLQI